MTGARRCGYLQPRSKSAFMVGLIIAFTVLFPAAWWFRKTYTGNKPERVFRKSDSVGFRSFSNNTRLSAIDHTLVFTGAKATTAALPDATACEGRVYSISNFSTMTPTPIVTIIPKDLQYIEEQPFCSLWLQDQSIMLISDGVNWKILRQFIPSSSWPWKTKGSNISYHNATAEMNRPTAVFYEISGN
jgi:hypothetical protein